MKYIYLFLISLILGTTLQAQNKNVLLILIDDLNTDEAAFGNNAVKTPNFDKLSTEGIRFTNAQCSFPVCGASRSSMMTGTYPETNGVVNLSTKLRDVSPNILTLPEYLKDNGYVTEAVGKIFDPRCIDAAYDASKSWTSTYKKPSTYSYRAGAGTLYKGKYRIAPTGPKGNLTEKGPTGIIDEDYVDGQFALDAISKLENYKNSGSKFFLAVGFKKPHTPFIAPKKYWDLYNINDIKLSSYQKLPVNTTNIAFSTSTEVKTYDDIAPLTVDGTKNTPFKNSVTVNGTTFNNVMEENAQKKAIMGYYAAVSYIDAQIGMLIDALEAKGLKDNTLIIITSDHGFALGDHGIWGKHNILNNSSQVPFIVIDPTQPSKAGTSEARAIQLIDIFPTVCDWLNLPKPTQLQGNSIFNSAGAATTFPMGLAVTHYKKNGKKGYSFKKGNYRYTLWTKKTPMNDTYDQMTNDAANNVEEFYKYNPATPQAVERENIINTNDATEQAALASMKVEVKKWWDAYKANHDNFSTIPSVVLATSITVNVQGGGSTITTNGGTLQMQATVIPANATDSSVTWSVVNGTGTATINSSGLLTATGNGTVIVKATANDGSGKVGTKVITISNQTNSDRNFFAQTWNAKTFDVPTNTTAGPTFASSNEDATVNVSTSTVINKILPVQLGVNTPFRSGKNMPTRLNSIYKPSGWGIYRFPAGSGSNEYFFDGNVPSSSSVHKVKTKNNIPSGSSESISFINGTRNNNFKPAQFADFIKDVDGEATVVVNYFYARYSKAANRAERVLRAAKYAAEFVKYMNITNNANIKYWEIGNEIYGKWEDGYYVDGSDGDGHFIGEVTPEEYGEDFVVFAREMKKIDPTIKVGAVILDVDDNKHDWNRRLLPKIQGSADFLAVHNYFLPAKDQSAANILAEVDQVGAIKNMLDDVVAAHTSKPAGYFPLAMTEFNTRAQIVSGNMLENHTESMLNAIFTAEVVAEMMKNGYGMSTKWVGEWKTTSPGQDQKGIIAVSDPRQANYSPRQDYFVFRYYDSYFGDELVQATTTGDNSIKVYASKFSDGKIGLSIVNESDTSKKVKINIPQASLKDAYWYEVYAYDNIDVYDPTTNPHATKFYINGQTSTTDGGGPIDFVNVPPYKASINNGDVFEAKKYSTTFMVITQSAMDVNEATEKVDFNLYPNPAANSLTIKGKTALKEVRIYDLVGKQVLLVTDFNNDTINVSTLSNGMYIITIEDVDHNRSTKKIMIAK